MLFEGNFPVKKPFSLIEQIDHPEGRLKNSELDADQPGRSMGSVSRVSHAYSENADSKRTLARHFARDLVARLEKGRVENRFRKVMLIAESRFLGELRSAMGSHLEKMVAGSLEKELHLMPLGQIQEVIKEAFRESPASWIEAA